METNKHRQRKERKPMGIIHREALPASNAGEEDKGAMMKSLQKIRQNDHQKKMS
jgi:hypothetical protein